MMTFQKGNKLGKGRPRVVPAGSEPSALLAAMRKVFGHTKDKDVGEEEKNCRRLLEADPDRFFDRLQKLEDGFVDRLRKLERDTSPRDGDDNQEVPMDAGTQRCVELAEKLLLEAKDKVSRCPNCGHSI